jgi:stage V sporulation protein B
MSLPLTSGKLISTIAYSLEPILMTTILLKLGFSSSYITNEYGIISGYVFPLLLMPGFFANAFSKVLLQPLTKTIAKKEYDVSKKMIINITAISFTIGGIFSIILAIFPKPLMDILYGTTKGYEYVRYFALPFVFYYVEAPLISAMTALNKTKKIMLYDTIVSLIRILSLFILLPRVNMMGVAISTIINSFLLVLFFTIEIIVFFRKKDKMII